MLGGGEGTSDTGEASRPTALSSELLKDHPWLLDMLQKREGDGPGPKGFVAHAGATGDPAEVPEDGEHAIDPEAAFEELWYYRQLVEPDFEVDKHFYCIPPVFPLRRFLLSGTAHSVRRL